MQNRILDIVVTPSGSPLITLQYAKNWMRVTHSEDDTIIGDLIDSCTREMEEFARITLISKSIYVDVDIYIPINKCESEFELPYGAVLNSLDEGISVNYRNGMKYSDYEPKTVDTDYFIRGMNFPRLVFTVAGLYGITYETFLPDVDLPIARSAVLADVAHRYEFRGDADKANGICPAARKLIQPLKRMIWE